MNSRSLIVLLFTTVLTACSGGGEGINPTVPVAPATYTVACPNGTTQTAATVALANLACPAPFLMSLSPADTSIPGNSGLTTSPDLFTGVEVLNDSTLDPSSLTTSNVKLMVGSLTIITGTVLAIQGTVPGCSSTAGFSTTTGAVCANNIYGFKFVPATKLQYGIAYTFIANVKDTLGKMLTVNSTFTTTTATCTAPFIWNGTICVDPNLSCTPPTVWNGTACAVHIP